MRDKPTPASGQYFAIPGLPLLTLEGRDAVRFAQAQFMNEVAGLAAGHWQWNGWLTPKGRLIALFALLRLDAESLLLLPVGEIDPAAFAARLQGFVFRSKLSIRVRDDLHVSGSCSAPASAEGARFAGTATDRIELDMGGEGGARTLAISAEPAPAADPEAWLRWRQFDLAHGLPRLPQAQLEQWTPQQLSLERLKAFSVGKGCYPGQEIVARTHFLGQAKRGLARFAGAAGGPGEVMPGTPDDAAGARAIGQLICAAGDEALAVLPLDAGEGPFHCAGHALTRLPLLDGLAR